MSTFDSPAASFYYPLQLSLTVSFAFSCLLVRSFAWRGSAREYSPWLIAFLVFAWLICLAILLYHFGSVMNFSGLDEIYAQRKRGAASGRFTGYTQTYFGYVFSPALLAFGLVRRSYTLIFLGILGGVFLYMITAEKGVFVFPFFIVFLFSVMRSKPTIITSSSFIMFVFSITIFLSVSFYEKSPIAEFIAWYLGVRSLLTPGNYTALYYNYFSDVSYTFWSHISGIGFFVDIPNFFLSHPRWPSLGHLIGEDYLGIPTLNANANFIASDGIASFGPTGVFFTLMLFSFFLILMDRCTRGLQPNLVIPLLLPLSLLLTNGSLFTALTSFGGFLFLIIFFIAFSKNLHYSKTI